LAFFLSGDTPLQHQAILLEAREIAPDIRHFVFAVDGVDRFPFLPGQFVSFTEQFQGKPITRAYSIASTPDGNRFELCLNLVKDGRFSPHLFQLKPGERVPMKGPVGSFTLRDPQRDALFVATGTGIAPMRGMLRQALDGQALDAQAMDGQAMDAQDLDAQDLDAQGINCGLLARYTLLFGVRYEESLLYREEFEALAAAHPQFRFVPTLTRPGNSWTGRTGRVQQHLADLLGGRTDVDVYVCGLKEMVNEVRDLLKSMDFDRRRIIVEKYD
jgi:CDP-4-dehydro-6-deoxyglucose reductase